MESKFTGKTLHKRHHFLGRTLSHISEHSAKLMALESLVTSAIEPDSECVGDRSTLDAEEDKLQAVSSKALDDG